MVFESGISNSKGRFVFVIPAYNHGRTVKAVATAALALGWPVYVVDDGSTDGCDPSLGSITGMRLLRHSVNRGKGAALMTGFREAAKHADWAITLDADGQHFPEDAHELIDAIPEGSRPIILGCRLQMSAKGAPWTSRFGREFSNFWIRMAGGPQVIDSQSGFRIYPLPEVLQLGVRAQRYQFEIEVLVKAAWSAMEVIEARIGVSYPPAIERVSHFRPVVDFWRNTTTFARLITRRVVLGRPSARKSSAAQTSRCRSIPPSHAKVGINMSRRFYAILAAVSNIFGAWLFALIARGIAAGYFFLFLRRAANSARFYCVLFAGRNRLYGWLCAWRQFQNFTTVFLDRYLLRNNGTITFTFQGREHLIQSLEHGRGGILLMSHIGNWEVGARLLRREIPQLPLMLFMGQRAKEQIERLQKEDLTASGIRVLAADQEADMPFALVEGASFLQTGGFVSMAGDMVWRPDQRVVAVRFLGCTVWLPEAPFMLALLSGAPLYVFFASRLGLGRHHFSVSGPMVVAAEHRAQRRQAVLRAAQAYADLLEDHVRRNPLEWYHFEPFLGPAVGQERSSPELGQTRQGKHSNRCGNIKAKNSR